jgi:phenylpyruvate tautomerase PptA (4-oxalocrotonate tautomerase family)
MSKIIIIPKNNVRLFQFFITKQSRKNAMPFVRTALRAGTDAKKQEHIVQAIHEALVSAIGMPEDELFNLVTHYNPTDFFYSRTFNGIARSDDVVVIEITMRRGRSDAMKKSLYATIAQNLESRAGVSPKDAFIFVHENDYSDWSVGNGAFAMALVQQRGNDC